MVGQLNRLNVRHFDHLDFELFALDPARGNAVSQRLPNAREKKLKALTVELPAHGRLFPTDAALEFREHLRGGRLEPDHAGGDDKVGPLANRLGTGLDDNLIQRRNRRVKPASPQARGSVAPIARPGAPQPNQHGQRGRTGGGVGEDSLRLDDIFRGNGFGNLHRVFSEQIEKRIGLPGGLTLGLIDKGVDTAVKRRHLPFNMIGGLAAPQPKQRADEQKDNNRGERGKKKGPRADHAGVRESKLVGEVNARDGQRQSADRRCAQPARGRGGLEAKMHAVQVVLELLGGSAGKIAHDKRTSRRSLRC